VRSTATLEFVRQVFHGAPFVAELGIAPTAIGAGRCESELVIRPQMLQHTGQVHAGVVTTLADHTAGAAAQSMIDVEGGVAITAELKISLLRPAQGERLVCRGRVLKPGKAISFVESEVFCIAGGKESLVAKVSATMSVVNISSVVRP